MFSCVLANFSYKNPLCIKKVLTCSHKEKRKPFLHKVGKL